MQTLKESPQVFEYSNYRDYLRDYYTARKHVDARFSYRFFAHAAGFSSPNFLQLVIGGQRNLSSESVEKVIKALRFKGEEASFFRDLVMLNQARDPETRRFHAQHLLRSKSYRRVHPLKQVQFEYFAHWYFSAIRELVSVVGFREDAEWIAKVLTPSITAAEASDALSKLQALGLLIRDEQGWLRQCQGASITSGDEVTSTMLTRWHQSMIELGSESIRRFPSVERDISGLTVAFSKAKASEAKVMIQRFRKELLALADADTAAERVYQIGFQLFPLSGSAAEDSSS